MKKAAPEKKKERADKGKPRPDYGAGKDSAAASDPTARVKWTDAALMHGASYLVKILWAMGNLVAWIAGAKLDSLTDAEAEEGAKEALPLLKRFNWLAIALTMIGLPVWFFSMLAAKLKWPPKPVEKVDAPKDKTAGPGATVVQLHQKTNDQRVAGAVPPGST